ncbi:MAG: DUF763 domain-containing protein, partial [Armatimonadota bacterium]|nr:DUF763 domain-containing protein [Armatimonadota bacterium]
MHRTGTATLPLHSGPAPRWLFARMVRLGRAILFALVEDLGPRGVLRRLSDPFWFQALGCLLGFDWHSSGLTTTVCGALKEAVHGAERDLGIFVVGGKGRVARATPQELQRYGDRFGVDADALIRCSRLSAKVDNSAVQDGYDLYHHTFFAALDGSWAVVQQGMRALDRTARRYHWLGEAVRSFTCEPHAAVCCDVRTPTLNLVAVEAQPVREAVAALARERPERLVSEFQRVLVMPGRHAVRLEDLHPRRL